MSHSTAPDPSQGQQFIATVCFVGRDVNYGVEAIHRLSNKGVSIAALCGETAELVFSQASAIAPIGNPDIYVGRRPWEHAEFFGLFSGDGSLLGINCGFDFIIPPSVLDRCPFLNIHPAALPFNRGCHHSFWGILDKTELGATLHWMTIDLDAGPIIAKKTFNDDGFMTAEQVQNQSNAFCLDLLEENILDVMSGRASSYPQGVGSYHSKSDILEASSLDEFAVINVSRLFDLCRATANRGNGFIVKKEGRKFLIRISGIEELRNLA
jgi:hypothetical protein